MDNNSPQNGEYHDHQAGNPPVRSLRELIDRVSGKSFLSTLPQEDLGLAEPLPYPFLALVGQEEMRLALLLSVINPQIGGVVLIGARGTGKTTAVRSILDLLPEVERSNCYFGCLPEDIEMNGMDAVCPECARKYGQGELLSRMEAVHLVELPLNSRIDDVIGGIDERSALHQRMQLKRGILANADRNVLYIDEVNLLSNDIVNAILDAAAAGTYTVRRGPISATYHSRFILIGSMNPEEGDLRPQIMDRFGLRVIVKGLDDPAQRLEVYRRVKAFQTNPHGFITQYFSETKAARKEIVRARDLLPKVSLPEDVARAGLKVIREMHIDSLRAELALFEASRAYAAADNRTEVSLNDLQAVGLMTLRLRASSFIKKYISTQTDLEESLRNSFNSDPFSSSSPG